MGFDECPNLLDDLRVLFRNVELLGGIPPQMVQNRRIVLGFRLPVFFPGPKMSLVGSLAGSKDALSVIVNQMIAGGWIPFPLAPGPGPSLR